ncbi:MAG: hypothetical protein IAE80_17645 [Anaerolinea sp.]|nr:hypothetical protein [Anaerolinea sp.]
MSEQELYEIARRRIDKRIRRWTVWSIDLALLIMTLAGQVIFGDTSYSNLSAALFLGWGGIFTLHTIIAALAESRDGQIESEVAKLRTAVREHGDIYEKPKRLELTDDGEMNELVDWQNVEDNDRTRHES